MELMANNTPIATQEDGSNLIPKCIGFGSANQDAFTTAEKSTIPKNNEMIYPAIIPINMDASFQIPFP